MGRQAYLNKIALGRSAYEPSQTTTQSSEYAQLASSQQEIPPESRDSESNKYIQLYDERGNPINPCAHEYGRQLREAQNDVLASIGVVERRRSPSQDLPGSFEDSLQQLEDEETAGNAIAVASTLTENVCTWWIGSLRERILTFRFQDALPFAQIVASERRLSGKRLMHSGFESRLLSTVGIQAAVYVSVVLQPIERLLRATHASNRTRRFYRDWKNTVRTCLRVSFELLFYPFAYHSYLQRLGLIPAKPFFPPTKALIPFSRWSPLVPFSIYHDASASPQGFLKAVLTSPFVFVCLEHFYERWVYSAVNEAIESSIMQPDNPDILSPDHGSQKRTTELLGLRRQPPPLVKNSIIKFLSVLGWVKSDVSPGNSDRQEVAHSIRSQYIDEGQTIEVGGTQITNLNRVHIPRIRQDAPIAPASRDQERFAIPVDSLSGMLPPTTPTLPPPSPTASQASLNDNDPRIRITSREGIVEMEVRLPHVLSSHTELADSGPPTPSQHNITSPNPARSADTRTYHRVTHLSTEPAQLIGAICKAQIVTWVTMPLRLVTLRLVASHYLASRPGYIGPRSVLDPWPLSDESTISSVGVQMSRIALCGALELVIDLSLWGCQYLAVKWMGTNAFGWGAL